MSNGHPSFQTCSEEETPVSRDDGIDNAAGGQLQLDILANRDIAVPREKDNLDHSEGGSPLGAACRTARQLGAAQRLVAENPFFLSYEPWPSRGQATFYSLYIDIYILPLAFP